MLGNSAVVVVVVVVVRTRPRAIPLAMTTMRKSTHGFPFLSHDEYGAPLGSSSGRRSSAKKMGSPCLFTRQQAFEMGYFCWLRVKNSNYFHAEFSPSYLGDAKFYLENEASFIDINSIPSFKLFLIAWLRE